jgi:3-methyladenine DNA glycosylase/8-oxoguanine DNA glycosylase
MMTTFNISAYPPFSFSAVLRSHGWIQMLPFHADPEYKQLTYPLRLNEGRIIKIILHEIPDGVRVQTYESLQDKELDDVVKKVKWMLCMDQDLSAFYEMASAEPKLSHVIQLAQGRILRSPTVFEDVVKTILTTNTLWAATLRMNANLVNLYGDGLIMESDLRAFPTASQLACLDEDTLRSKARLGYRAPYVLELAQAVQSGDLDLEALKVEHISTEQLRKRLLAIKGIGSYAAANLLMLLGHYGFVPVDSWARKVVSQEWYGGNPVEPAQVEAAFQRWGPWKGLAYWFWDWNFKG